MLMAAIIMQGGIRHCNVDGTRKRTAYPYNLEYGVVLSSSPLMFLHCSVLSSCFVNSNEIIDTGRCATTIEPATSKNAPSFATVVYGFKRLNAGC